MAYDPSRGVSAAAGCVINVVKRTAAATAAGRRVLGKVTLSPHRAPGMYPGLLTSAGAWIKGIALSVGTPLDLAGTWRQNINPYRGLAMTPENSDAPGQGLFRGDEFQSLGQRTG